MALGIDVSRYPASEDDGTRTRNHRIDSSVAAAGSFPSKSAGFAGVFIESRAAPTRLTLSTV
jgi:hypothetical protein